MNTRNTLTPWLTLIRLPNLLTVPGDPAAGFLLAAAGASQPPKPLLLFASAGASLGLYLFGLILNDLVDREADLRERPERPLPAGEITVPQARMAAIAMALSGLNLALVAGRFSLYVAAALAGVIILYNVSLKRVRFAGVCAMGLCRGLSLLLGAVAARPDLLTRVDAACLPVFVAALGLTLYVVCFSVVARREMEPEKPQGFTRWLPFTALLFFLPALMVLLSAQKRLDALTPTVYVFLMVMTLMRAWLLGGLLYRLAPVPVTVGGHIRNLLMVQACLCVAAGQSGLLPAVLFVLLSLVFARLSARFYSS
ncbi:MAG: UbiA family prenyltransferase [bacterium]